MSKLKQSIRVRLHVSSVHPSTYADLACANNSVYFWEEEERERDSEADRHRMRGGRVVDLSIKGDHILATEPLSRD